MTDPCSSYRTRLHLYLDGEVGPLEVREIETHLVACPQCQSSLDEMKSIEWHLRAGLRDFVDGDNSGFVDGLSRTIDRVMKEPIPRWKNSVADPSARSRRRIN